MYPLLLLVWALEVQGFQGESRPCGGPPVWSPVWRRVLARSQRAGVSESAAEPGRRSGSEELHPAKTLKVRWAE